MKHLDRYIPDNSEGGKRHSILEKFSCIDVDWFCFSIQWSLTFKM